MRLEIRLLGPLDVAVDGKPVRVTGRSAVMLAMLAMSAGRIVSLDRLVTATWGDELPDNARASVQTVVMRLRRLIGADLITTDAAGYLLSAGPEEIDALRFVDLLDQAASTMDSAVEYRLLGDALVLWRGNPFEGVRSAWLAQAQAPRLVERYLAAVERRADLDLAAGRHDGLVAQLRDVLGRHPLRETLWIRYLSVLDMSGRRAEALEHYEEIRRRIADELGAGPSPQLQAMHLKLLADERPPPPTGPQRLVPRQLPVDVAGFVGREEVLSAMDSRVGDAASPLVITAIGGAAGIGKTALAVHWAHRVAGSFPDGQLYANLRGFDPSGTPRVPEEVLRGFLNALQVPPSQVPSALEAQVGLYRSLLAGRRMLILLDNARDAEQVRPLLPGSPGSQVVVTSRDELTGLIAAEGARPLVLDVLSTQEAWQLLDRRLGPQRAAADPQAVERIIRRCARLPLALSVVAARAAQRPETPMSALAAELDGARTDLDAFASGDPMIDVRAVFSWSYRTLSAPAARLFRLLSVHPGPDVSAPAASAVAGLPLARTMPVLAELIAAHLISEPIAGRYTFHDLLRAYSGEMAAQIDTEEQRRAALVRMLDHYLHTAYAGAVVLDPHRVTITLTPLRDGVTPEDIADFRRAVEWFATERPVLLAAFRQAVQNGLREHAWQTAWALSGYLDMAGYWSDRVATLHATLEIDPPDWPWQAFVHRSLGHSYVRMGQLDPAHTHLQQALALFRHRGDRIGEARTHLNIGIVLDRQARHEEGLVHAKTALELYCSADHIAGQAGSLNALGWHHAQLGNFQTALGFCEQALELHQKLDHRHGEADLWDSIGYINLNLGNHDVAVSNYEAAIGIFQALGNRVDEAGTLVNLGDVHLAAGNHEAARDVWQRALAIFDDLDHPNAMVRAKLDALTHDDLAASTSDG